MIITFLCRARELNERVDRIIRLECRHRNAWSVVLEFLPGLPLYGAMADR